MLLSFIILSCAGEILKKVVKQTAAGETPSLKATQEKHIDNRKLEALLIQTIEDFLWALDSRELQIIISRWGFGVEKKSLITIANEHKVSRQAINNIERKLNKRLSRKLKGFGDNLKKHFIQNKLYLRKMYPNLFKCFGDNNFYRFLEINFDLTKNSLREPPIELSKAQRILSDFFSTQASPIRTKELAIGLSLKNGITKDSATQIIQESIEYNLLKEVNNGLAPQNLYRKESVAHVLMSFPNGLPWKDIVNIINKNNYSAQKLDDRKSISGYFSDSELIYLYSQGNYRNIAFFDVAQEEIKFHLGNLKHYIQKQDYRSVHLYDYYSQKIKEEDINYFDLRYIVKRYGEKNGIFFVGKSNSETVGLAAEPERISQEEVIIRSLNSSESAMTKEEISKFIRSKSKNHAATYLNALINKGEVVRIDRTLYTTTKKAYEKIDKNKILNCAERIIRSTDKIIEVDVIKTKINKEMNLSYSKYFYDSLMKQNLKTYNWYNSQHLFCSKPINYKSLQEIYDQVYTSELTFLEIYSRLQKTVFLTHAVAKRLVANNK